MGEFLDGGGFGNGGGIGGFGDLLGAEALALVLQLYAILAAVANFIWGVLVAVANFLYNLIHTVGNFLVGIFRDHILPVFRTLVNDYLRLKAWLLRVFGPIIRIIQRIRSWYLIHILPWQKLVVEIIQRVRIALEVLRFLHVKWAAKLDADLAKIQGYVTESITLVLGTLNRASTILGIMLDPLMILRKDFFVGTIFSHLAALKRAVGFGNGRDLSASEAQGEDDARDLLNPRTPPVTRQQDGTVVLSPALQEIVTGLRQAGAAYVASNPV